MCEYFTHLVYAEYAHSPPEDAGDGLDADHEHLAEDGAEVLL